MIITVTQDYKKAVFTWGENFEECDYKAHGFSDDEIDLLIKNNVHEGADLEGFKVSIT